MWYDRAQATDFQIGETVFYPLGEFPPKFPGKVLAIHPRLNQLDVQWPSGTRRMSPEDIITASVWNVVMKKAEALRPVVNRLKELTKGVVSASVHDTIYGEFPELTRSDLDLVLGALDKEGSLMNWPDSENPVLVGQNVQTLKPYPTALEGGAWIDIPKGTKGVINHLGWHGDFTVKWENDVETSDIMNAETAEYIGLVG
jgi:hypothetical protein